MKSTIARISDVILVCGMLGAATLGVSRKTYSAVCKRTVGHVAPVLVTMGSLLVVAYIMQSPSTGMMNLLASDIVLSSASSIRQRRF